MFVALMVIVSVSEAQAAARYWDRDAGGGLLHGDGTWNTADANWNASSDGSGVLTTFASGTDYPAFNGVGGTSLILVPNTISSSGINPPWLGAGYTLVVTNGATLTLHQVTGIGENRLGSNNTLKIVGGNGITSVFNAQYDVYVGRYSTNANNSLVADGAGYAGSAVITNVRDLVLGGNNGDYFGSNSNSVQIVNGGRLFMNTAGSDLRIGDAPGSMGNYMIVTNGSLLSQTISANVLVGRPFATNNWVLVKGGPLGSSLWALSSSGNDLLIGSGNTSVLNRVTIDGAGAIGGAFVTNVGANAASALVIGNGTGADNNCLEIINGGIVYMRGVNNYLYVGNGALRRDNSLAITNGGQLLSVYSITVGGAQATNNYALVQGGTVGMAFLQSVSVNGIFVGNGASSFNNRMTVDGLGIAGSAMVTNAGPLNIGAAGTGAQSNSVQIINGGVFKNIAGTLIGVIAGSYDNFMSITNGGEYQIGNTVDVGSRGTAGVGGSSNNWMLIQGGNGATSTVRSTTGGSLAWTVGLQVLCSGNRLTVDGLGFPGSAIVTNVSTLRVGVVAAADSNRLEVLNGGYLRIASQPLTVGVVAGATGNVVQINGGDVRGVTALNVNGTFGSVEISNNGLLYLGAAAHNIGSGAGNSNTLSVSSGGLLDGAFQNMNIGYSGSTGNVVMVNGGTISNINTLFIGETGIGSSFNQLVITNGGRVFSRLGSLGASTAGQVSNMVTVTGTGSFWNLNGYNLAIGLPTTTNNSLTIDAGGMVTNVAALLINTNNSVNLLGGILSIVSAQATNRNGGAFTVGDGVKSATLQLNGGINYFAQGLTVNTNATLRGTGSISNAPSFINTIYGTFAPGNDVGPFTNAGNFTLAANSTTVFEIATNMTASGWGDTFLVTNGTLTLGGTLKVVLLGDFTPAGGPSGDKFIIMTNCQNLAGTFANSGAKATATRGTTEGAPVGIFDIVIDNNRRVVLQNMSSAAGMDPPQINNAGGATGILNNIAWLNGTLVSTGSAPTEVYAYWGTVDGGTTNGQSSLWENTNYFGTNTSAVPPDKAYTTNVSLLPLTTYYYIFHATNMYGGAWNTTGSSNFITRGDPPAINNTNGASTITAGSAVLNGTLTSTGNAPAVVYVYWGTVDGGNTNGSGNLWANTNFFGTNTSPVPPDKPYSTNVSLSPLTQYYYRFFATNSWGEAWSPASSNFTTPGAAPAINNTNGASAITAGSATLNGTLTSTGSAPTEVYVYWGTVDGGNTNGAGSLWAHTNYFGTNTAVPSVYYATNITTMNEDTLYYYRFYATNSWGDAWAPATIGFSTLKTRYVAKHGNNENNGLQATPWQTIQFAVTNVVSGDTILIGEGTYIENVVLTNTIHTLTIKGGHNTNDWSWSPSNHTTVISGTAGARIQLGGDSGLNGLPSVSNTIMGLTLCGVQFGIVSPYHSSAKSTVTISHCVITNQGAGYGVYGYGACDFNIINTVFAKAAVGIYHYGGAGITGTNLIFNCTFATNLRANIWVGSGGKTIIRNTIAHGAYGAGGAGNEGYGIAVGATAANSADVSHSLVYGNTVNTNGLVTYGDGMITNQAPGYVSYDGLNFRLAPGSPCIDGGTNLVAVTNDLDLNQRPWGTFIHDIGAYEAFNPRPSGTTYVFF